ncbi:hypothetical protein [Nocardioides sp. REDSEA-S30_B4]|jgi:hypothetical protein|uniref:hypothetical protein n=1 Tax=Nocardioides sp. REDSEA-S30_B4 TaxID=1811552 RepID=UPI000AD2252B|nr:hypothetical protein [Nocardioides sp. REDSEA-S30_B4]
MSAVVISGPFVRSVNVDIVNAAGLTEVACVRIDRDGVWFAEPLTGADEFAVREWLSSRDDADLAWRAAFRAIASTTEAGELVNGFEILRAGILGDPLPEPVYAPATPDPPQEA